MSSKIFCSISKYLEKKHPKLFSYLADDLCIDSELRVKRNLSGSTFIIPTDSHLKKMMSMGEDKAVDDMLNYVLRDFLPSAAEWAAKAKDIPNGHGKKATVVAGKEVEVNGVKITLVGEFKPFSSGPNGKTKLSVWKAVAGEMKPSTEKADFTNTRVERSAGKGKTPKKGKKNGRRKRTRGGMDATSSDSLSDYIKKVEEDYRAALQGMENGRLKCPYTQALAGYLAFCKVTEGCDHLDEIKHCDPGPHGSFYALFGNPSATLPGLCNPKSLKLWQEANYPEITMDVANYLNLLEGNEIVGGANDPIDYDDDVDKASLASAYEYVIKKYGGTEEAEKHLGYDEIRALLQEKFYVLEEDFLATTADLINVIDEVNSMTPKGGILCASLKLSGIQKKGVESFANSPWCAYTLSKGRSHDDWKTRKTTLNERYIDQVKDVSAEVAMSRVDATGGYDGGEDDDADLVSGGKGKRKKKKNKKKGGDYEDDDADLVAGGEDDDADLVAGGEDDDADLVSGGKGKRKKNKKKGGEDEYDYDVEEDEAAMRMGGGGDEDSDSDVTGGKGGKKKKKKKKKKKGGEDGDDYDPEEVEAEMTMGGDDDADLVSGGKGKRKKNKKKKGGEDGGEDADLIESMEGGAFDIEGGLASDSNDDDDDDDDDMNPNDTVGGYFAL
jgi:hypothetical protein